MNILLFTSHSLFKYSPSDISFERVQKVVSFFRETERYIFQLSQPHVRSVLVTVLNNSILTNLHITRLLIPGIKYYGYI